ncbi:MAG: hypothetical protein K2M34_00685 [Alphaproteobacteria bacterium]|nr:hypothetical protein [Alphaproteobacteria bacterium]
MKWLTYLHRTPLAQIRADWSEYMGLWRKCVALRGLRNAAYNKIILSVNADSVENPSPSCVQQTYYYTKSPAGQSGNDMLDNMLWVAQSTCKKFRENGDGVKCEKSDCPCVADNHEYADACARYSLMHRARRDFWRVKSAQAMQRKK